VARVQLRLIENPHRLANSAARAATPVQVGDGRYIPAGALVTSQAEASRLPYQGRFHRHQASDRPSFLRLVA
jgi:hypothetical protein